MAPGRTLEDTTIPTSGQVPSEVDLPVLVCDLDSTLVRTDTLYESFWAAVTAHWTAPFGAIAALTRGRAALKAHLAGKTVLKVASLPFNKAVLDELRAWRAKGGRTALVSAADQSIVDAVATHIDLFDEAHGSDGKQNLKGRDKARFLNDRYGARQYIYFGDSRSDLAVWREAAEGVGVNLKPALRAKADAQAKMRHIGQSAPVIKPMIRALRPHQWAKNVLVLLPMIAGHALTTGALVQSIWAFVAFSLVASSVYVLNDLLDLAADRAHPRKRDRPFASGDLPLVHGTWMAPALLFTGVAISVVLGPAFLGVMALYYLTTTLYSLWLKRRPVIDICTLAALYALRVMAGSAATGIELSVWLLAFSTFFFFALAAVKRQAELVDASASGRELSGRGYQLDDLPLITMMALASGNVSVMVMALYVNSPEVTELYSRPEMLWGICAVLLYWLSRMVFITHRGRMHDDPVVFAAKDRLSHVMFIVILVFFAGGSLF